MWKLIGACSHSMSNRSHNWRALSSSQSGPGGGPSNQLFNNSRLEGGKYWVRRYSVLGCIHWTIHPWQPLSSEISITKYQCWENIKITWETFSSHIHNYFAFTHFPVECYKYYLFRWLCKLVAQYFYTCFIGLCTGNDSTKFSLLCVWMRMRFIWS